MLNKLEKKLGKYAIENLMVYLIGGYIIGYILMFGSTYTNVNLINYVTFEPYYIIHGLQLWRIVSWVLIPSASNPLFAVIMMILYYQLGTALERTWGTFKFNVYIFGGIIFTIIGAFVLYGIYALMGTTIMLGSSISTYYINLSIFLAFAVCFPDMKVMLYFIIPVKMKWMAILYAVIVGYELLLSDWGTKMVIICSLLNFIIFFFSSRNYKRIDPREIHRRNEFKRAAAPPPSHTRTGAPISRHRCAVCGRTELTNPELEFRFCSKCNGNYEYCNEHLFTHEHVK